MSSEPRQESYFDMMDATFGDPCKSTKRPSGINGQTAFLRASCSAWSSCRLFLRRIFRWADEGSSASALRLILYYHSQCLTLQEATESALICCVLRQTTTDIIRGGCTRYGDPRQVAHQKSSCTPSVVRLGGGNCCADHLDVACFDTATTRHSRDGQLFAPFSHRERHRRSLK